jgi:hypothetical protein
MEKRKKKYVAPLEQTTDGNGCAEKTIILASVARRKWTVADIKMRRVP